MKKILVFTAFVCAYLPTLSYSGEYLSEDERTATFCGKTYDGENLKSGWTYRIYSHSSCDKITIHYLTGDDAGKTFERRVTRYPSGENCVKFEMERTDAPRSKPPRTAFIINTPPMENIMVNTLEPSPTSSMAIS